VDAATARRLRETVGTRAEVIAVVADLARPELEELRDRTQIRWLQLHGSEQPAALAELLPGAFKALRVADARDVEEAARYGGERLLVDAKVKGELGGTGHTFDWSLVTQLARERALVLAGGLTPENVAAAVRFVAPYGVDTASGVEGADPRRKDAGKVHAFVRAARAALLALAAAGSLALTACSPAPPTRQLVPPDAPLPGVVAGVFQAQHCRDASGGKLTLGPRFFVALAPPGLVGEGRGIEQGKYPPAVLTLLDQRVGYEGVLISHGRHEGDALVYRSPIEARDGRALIEEVRLPLTLSGNGALSLSEAQPGPGRTVSGTPAGAPHPLLLHCELVASAGGLDRARGVDYEPERDEQALPSQPPQTP
jgi:phosphoribosylanthranilate isomerase